MYLHDHLEKLKYFYEVAKAGSMKRASLIVYISQPSLTKSIKILEGIIGSTLFIRLPRGVKLTKEGQILLNFCHDLFSKMADVEQKLAFPEDPHAGSLKIGTYDSIGIYFWPSFLKNFLPLYPQIDFELTTGRSQLMQEKLEDGELDLILVVGPKQTPFIDIKILKKDTFKLYASSKSKTVYKDINQAPIILMPSALAGSKELKETLYINDFSDRKFYNCSSLESVKELTLNGIGIGLLPQMVAQDDLQKRRLKEIKTSFTKSGFGQHEIGIAYRKAHQNSPLIELIVKELDKTTW